jgi:plastocyanin
MPSIRLSLVLVGLAIGVTACSGGKNDNPAAPTPSSTVAVAEGKVVIRDISYQPARQTTRVGKEVTWEWSDNGINHTVTADDGSFDSGRMSSGEFKHTFDRAGEVAYHCQIHARMKGIVAVGS